METTTKRIFYFEELAHSGSGKRTLHKVETPHLNESGGSVAVNAINAFNSGKRKVASKEDREYYREFDYHRIQGNDEKYRENFDSIFRKKLTPTGESIDSPQSSRASDASVIREGNQYRDA